MIEYRRFYILKAFSYVKTHKPFYMAVVELATRRGWLVWHLTAKSHLSLLQWVCDP
jgi:hypothetical protein